MDATRDMSAVDVPSEIVAPLEAVVCTNELVTRPWRSPDYKRQNVALTELMAALATSPGSILQKLAEAVLDVLQADSAGVSLLTTLDGGKRFYWPAIAGAWKPYAGRGAPRELDASGDVLTADAPMLFRHFERRYAALAPPTPIAEEALFIPFHSHGTAVGTLWAIAHDERRRFDAEDLRQLESLGHFASATYHITEWRDADDSRRAALNLMEDAVHARQTAELINAELRESEERLRTTTDALRQSVSTLSESDRRKSEFLATLAHELRNPLASICNSLKLMRLSSDGAKEAPLASEILERQVTQLVRLVDDLLDVSRINRGKVELRRETIELSPIVKLAVETVRPAVEGRGVELVLSLPPQRIMLNADADRLTQVLGNLLNNACKFTDSGGRVSVFVESEGSQVVIVVRDTGVGIAAEQLPVVFEMFTQAESTIGHSAGGLGIGLSLAKAMVERHGGTLQARSGGVNQGSEFEVRLPIVDESVDAEREPQRRKIGKPETGGSRRILVVDDNWDSARTMSMLMEFAGHETRMVHDGEAAVESAESYHPDIVLLDIGLPKLNGYDVARSIRGQPWGKRIVLVALTGWGQEDDKRKSTEAGFDAHVVKPVDFEMLLGVLASHPARTE